MKLPTLTYSVPEGIADQSASPALYVGTVVPTAATVSAALGSLFINVAANSIYIKDEDEWHILTGGGGTPITWSDITGDPNTNPDLIDVIEAEAADAIATHVAAPNPHPVYLTEAEADALYDAIGAALAAVATHEAASNPHPQYLTEAEANALYDALGAAAASMVSHLAAGDPHPQYLTGAEGDAAYAALVHTHPAAAISDSTVAGRLMLTALDAAVQTALLNTFTPLLKGLVPLSGGGTTNFLRADGVFALPPGGAGAFAVTRATVNLPYPASRRHSVNVVDAAMAATDKILVSLAGVDETQTNASDGIDPLGFQALAKAGSFDLQISFLTPAAGPLVIDYARSA